MVVYMLEGQRVCTNDAVIHKVGVQRCGHRRCALVGTDACIDGTVKAKVKCIIDRGEGRKHSPQDTLKASCHSLDIGEKFNSRVCTGLVHFHSAS